MEDLRDEELKDEEVEIEKADDVASTDMSSEEASSDLQDQIDSNAALTDDIITSEPVINTEGGELEVTFEIKSEVAENNPEVMGEINSTTLEEDAAEVEANGEDGVDGELRDVADNIASTNLDVDHSEAREELGLINEEAIEDTTVSDNLVNTTFSSAPGEGDGNNIEINILSDDFCHDASGDSTPANYDGFDDQNSDNDNDSEKQAIQEAYRRLASGR